jgi:hypothetical protein
MDFPSIEFLGEIQRLASELVAEAEHRRIWAGLTGSDDYEAAAAACLRAWALRERLRTS